jgi:pimeloyl-ACP methyl ester carboxylesterase
LPELAYRSAGEGPPLLLVHGGGEDIGLLTPQAEAFAAAGYRVIWYDRRGTGASTRDGWPDGGVAVHADDAAALLRALDAVPATVLGFSSGAVVALELAARHLEVVTEVVAWEPPALGVLPDGAALHDQIMAPLEAHLAAHPGDWVGAYCVFLELTSDGEADLTTPTARRMARNAETMLRDDARIITRHGFAPGELPPDRVTVAIGGDAGPLHIAIAQYLQAQLGRPTLLVEEADDHEVYLDRPEVLVGALAGRARAPGPGAPAPGSPLREAPCREGPLIKAQMSLPKIH